MPGSLLFSVSMASAGLGVCVRTYVHHICSLHGCIAWPFSVSLPRSDSENSFVFSLGWPCDGIIIIFPLYISFFCPPSLRARFEILWPAGCLDGPPFFCAGLLSEIDFNQVAFRLCFIIWKDELADTGENYSLTKSMPAIDSRTQHTNHIALLFFLVFISRKLRREMILFSWPINKGKKQKNIPSLLSW